MLQADDLPRRTSYDNRHAANRLLFHVSHVNLSRQFGADHMSLGHKLGFLPLRNGRRQWASKGFPRQCEYKIFECLVLSQYDGAVTW